MASSRNFHRSPVMVRFRPAAALARNSVAQTRSTFTATIWPIRDVDSRLSFMEMGSSPHIGTKPGFRQCG